MTLSRRSVLASAAGLAFTGLARSDARAAAGADSVAEGYGPLRPDPAGLFDLPAGFSYSVVSRAGEPMSDGFVTPYSMDGMGCFAGEGDHVVLVRNHELKPKDRELSAFGPGRALAARLPADRIYDRHDDGLPMAGGTTTLVYDLKARRLVSSRLSLAGTSTNCAGGTTPWGSWLSCEETTQKAGDDAGRDHGWAFEVPSALNGVADPVPLVGLGRFRHEATAIDPRTGVVYLTEDLGDGLFYRFLPDDRTRLSAGGRLQALALPEGAQADPRNWETTYWRPGDWRDARWVDLDGVDNPDDDLRHRGAARGAARFARGEGLFFGSDEVFAACTNGGARQNGQILRYRPSPAEGQPGERDAPGRVQLFCEPTDGGLLRMGDNLAVAPWGHLFVCEDKLVGKNALRAVTPDGRLYTVGRNPGSAGVGANAELAGVCFSPDGSTMFVNIYSPGVTLAVTGPWERVRA